MAGLDLPSSLHNDYAILRHGESLANVAEIISSDPRVGTKMHGLTKEGRKQVVDSVVRAQRDDIADMREVIIFSSDFLRTRETADIAHALLARPSSPGVLVSPLLRERFFGMWDGGSNRAYQTVWDMDAVNPDHTKNRVESATSVRRRGILWVLECERRYKSRMILGVTHGDFAQILQTAFERRTPAEHRSLEHLPPAGIRKLVLAPMR